MLGQIDVIANSEKGDKINVTYYRDISLSSIFSKVFSQVLDSRLRKLAEQNNLLTDYQFGFRQQKSTIDCISFHSFHCTPFDNYLGQ